jgi:tRNA dimethylallyltransferase
VVEAFQLVDTSALVVRSKLKMKQKVIAIVGPTASGKSSLAVALALKFHGEIISADSRQIYKGLNLGTGKITKQEMMGIPHHLLDIWNPKKAVSVAEFKQKAEEALEEIVTNKKVPVVCGGTGFYIDTFLFNRELPHVEPNVALRKKLEKLPTQTLGEKLLKLDPRRAKEIDLKNRVRIIRAIEIVDALGVVPPLTDSPPYDVLFIGLNPSEQWLKAKIKTRLQERMQKGMVREAQNLHKNGLTYKRMIELGLEYKYLALFLQKKISKEEMITELEKEIWQYSKRQMTWFRKNKSIVWLKPELKTTPKKAGKLVSDFLKKFGTIRIPQTGD